MSQDAQVFARSVVVAPCTHSYSGFGDPGLPDTAPLPLDMGPLAQADPRPSGGADLRSGQTPGLALDALPHQLTG